MLHLAEQRRAAGSGGRHHLENDVDEEPENDTVSDWLREHIKVSSSSLSSLRGLDSAFFLVQEKSGTSTSEMW